MQKAINYVCAADLVFIAMLSLAGMLAGFGAKLLYYLAFLVPAAFIFIAARSAAMPLELPRLAPTRRGVRFLVPVAAPFLALVSLISFLTALLLGALGFSSTTDVSGKFFLVVLEHALLPALLEEGLFRFLPIALIAPHSKKNAVFFSALFFALIHCNLFQIPYAFAAGLVLAAVTVLSGSIFPAFVLHFINNLSSIILMRTEEGTVSTVFYIALGVLCAASAVFMIAKRKTYKAEILQTFDDKCKIEFTIYPILFVGATLFVAIFNLLVNV